MKDRGLGYVFTKSKYVDHHKPQLKRMFNIFDNDESGEIDLKELEAALHDYKDVTGKGLPKLEIRKLLELFNELDGVQDDGMIDFEEFVSVMKTSSSFADPRSFYFLNDEHCADNEATEKFAAFSNLYERMQNQREISTGLDIHAFKKFHQLFAGTYNLPTSVSTDRSGRASLGAVDVVTKEKIAGIKRTRKRKRRTLLRGEGEEEPTSLVERGSNFSPIKPLPGMRNATEAKWSVGIRANAFQEAGQLIGLKNEQLPRIAQKYKSPMKSRPQCAIPCTPISKALKTAFSATSGSLQSSRKGSARSSVQTQVYSRQRSTRGLTPFSGVPKVEITKSLHRRTQAVIGMPMNLPEPKFPLVTTW